MSVSSKWGAGKWTAGVRTVIVCSAFVLAGSSSVVSGQEESATEELQANQGIIQLVVPTLRGPDEQAAPQSDAVGLEQPAAEPEGTAAPLTAEPVATEEIREVVGTGQFGHYERRSAPRPYGFIGLGDLDENQRDAVQRWERNPFYLVWIYDITPSAANNWAGWGPPPPGFMDRTLFERGPNGSLIGEASPWPPPGDPPAR